MTGIIGALKIEIDGLVAKIEDIRTEEFGGYTFYLGTLCGKQVVVAVCGMGKVYSAVAATIMIVKYGASEIINIGIAGGVALNVSSGDIVIADKSIQHDFDMTAEGLPIGAHTPTDDGWAECSADVVKKLATIAAKNHRVHVGTVVTGDRFVASSEYSAFLREKFGALACDMETSAIAVTARAFGVKFAALRAISDGGDDTAIQDYAQFALKATAIAIEVITAYLAE